MKIETFALEQWMDEHENKAKHNLSETECAPVSINELIKLSSSPDAPPESLLDLSRKQDYGNIRGLPALRSTLSGLYSVRAGSPLAADNILITPGAIAANTLVFQTLIEPGDHVICHYPTYQQLYEVPAALGAQVDLWKAKPEDDWELDIDELKGMIKPNTKLIVLNNPQNPTGAILKRSLLQKIVNVASESGKITILSDEVYRPLFFGTGPMDPEFPPSLMSLMYDNTIVTGSTSKAYSLAGLRVGWVASRSTDFVERCAKMRHYTTLSVSELDQQVASFALGGMCLHNLLQRNIGLAKSNVALVEKFVKQNRASCDWVKPVAGTTAFIQFTRGGVPVDSRELCEAMLAEASVLMVPGAVFGAEFPGYVRLGFACEESVLRRGLEELASFMQSGYAKVTTSQ